MKRKIFSKLLMGAFLIASVSMFVSCKDYDDDISKVNADVAALKTSLDSQIKTLTDALNQAKSDAATAHATFATKVELANAQSALENADEANATAIKANVDAINALKEAVAASATVAQMEQAVAELKALAEAQINEEELAAALAILSAQIDAINEDLNTLKTDVPALKAWKETVDASVLAVTTDLATQKAAIDALQAAMTGKADAATVEAIAAQLATKADASAVEAVVAALGGKADASAVQTALAGKADASAIATLTEAIQKLNTAIAGKLDKGSIAGLANEEAVKAYIAEQLKAYAKAGVVDASTTTAINNALKSYKTAAELNTILGDYATKTNITETLKAYYTATQLDKQAEDAKKYIDNQIKAVKEAAITEVKVSEIAQNAANKVSSDLGAQLVTLNVFVMRNLTSLVFRPDVYFGGIEGMNIFTFNVFVEDNQTHNKKQPLWHYFDRVKEDKISDWGVAKYHVNPLNVDLTKFDIDFYNHLSDIKEPAAWERVTPTRSGDADGIAPVYKTTDELLKANKDYYKDGILTVPFTANATAIEANLKIGKGTIASLQLTKAAGEKNDTTVNSDYAIVVPTYAKGLLIGDNTFKPVGDRYMDQIGYLNTERNSANLHRSFSFLALGNTTATHEIKYDESFDITEVLVTRYLHEGVWEKEITDTAVYVNHNAHAPIAKWTAGATIDDPGTVNKDKDGDASVDVADCTTMDQDLLDRLGWHYEINRVDYTLGSTKTSESNHIELIKDEKTGHIIAYPRNVEYADGATITGKTADHSAVGRMPIVCIELKDKDNRTLTFAWMKFLITEEAPVEANAEFNVGPIYVNCEEKSGEVKWHQIENAIYSNLVNMSKQTFDANYVWDYYYEVTEADLEHASWEKTKRYAIQYAAQNGKRLAADGYFGDITEEWNFKTATQQEDATTHIIKWTFSDKALKETAEALKDAGKLTTDDSKPYYWNKEDIVRWVRYAHKGYTAPAGASATDYAVAGGDAPAVGAAPTKGVPSIWVKMVIKTGDFRVAKGDMGANKILTYWYNLNSKVNAEDAAHAFEVRMNAPVPVPAARIETKYYGYDYPTNTVPLYIKHDNLLENANNNILTLWADGNGRPEKNAANYSEFTKNLKDYFIGGKLEANVTDKVNFNKIKGMKLGFEFIEPSTTVGNATFNANSNGEWTVNGYTGANYTLKIDADRTKIWIVKKNGGAITPELLMTLNYDEPTLTNGGTPAADRQISVLNYVQGVDQDDILNYKTHNELAERETFTAYINIKAVDACAPVYWSNMWFNVRVIRPCDLVDPNQALAPDAPNDWHLIDLSKVLNVIDWRDYYGDPSNSIKGEDKTFKIQSGATVKGFDFNYYQIELDINDKNFKTDANMGTSKRNNIYVVGQMPNVNGADAAYLSGCIATSDVPNLKLEKCDKDMNPVPAGTKTTYLRYLNNSGVTGGFHIFVPIEMTYVYGFQTVKQHKLVTVGITSSVNQVQY